MIETTNNIQKVLEIVTNIYDHAKSIHNNDKFILENPYHRRLQHPSTGFSFIKEAKYHYPVDKLAYTPPLLVSTLIHDLANLYTDYKGHEIDLVYLMIEVDQELGNDRSFNEQIRTIYQFEPKIPRSLPAKKLRTETKSIFKEIYNIYRVENKPLNWERTKIFILSTYTDYLSRLMKDQAVIVNELTERMIEGNSIELSRNGLEYLIETKLTDDELEDPLIYLIFSEQLIKVSKRYARLYKEDITELLKDIILMRLSDYGHFFSPENYEHCQRDFHTFLRNSTVDVMKKGLKTEVAEGDDSLNWNTRQLTLALNLYVFIVRCERQRFIKIPDTMIQKLEAIIMEILSTCWAL